MLTTVLSRLFTDTTLSIKSAPNLTGHQKKKKKNGLRPKKLLIRPRRICSRWASATIPNSDKSGWEVGRRAGVASASRLTPNTTKCPIKRVQHFFRRHQMGYYWPEYHQITWRGSISMEHCKWWINPTFPSHSLIPSWLAWYIYTK